MSVEDELKAIREELRRLADRAVAPVPPKLVKRAEARKLLGGISESKLKRLIRSRAILTVSLDGMRMIPMREIERLSTPEGPAPRPGRPRRPKASPKSTAKERAAAIDRLARSKD